MNPLNNESIEELRRRLPKALARVFDVEFIIRIPTEQPARFPEHVFDHVDRTGTAWRMVVSIEKLREKPPVLHLSFSTSKGRPAARNAMEFWASIVNEPVGVPLAKETEHVLHLIFDIPRKE